MYKENKLIGFKSENFIEILIAAYDDILDNRFIQYPYNDRALNIAFKIHKKDVGDALDGIIAYHDDEYKEHDLYKFICGNFCKKFRQCDVIEDNTRGLSDMLVWNLINGADHLDKALKATCMYYEKVKLGGWSEYLLSDIVEVF